MEHLKLDLWTFDVGSPTEDAAAFTDSVTSRVIESWDAGADLVVFPEFTWMGLERFIAGPDKAVVPGTVPFVEIGRLAVFSPSQSAFRSSGRQIASQVFTGGFHRMSAELDLAAIRENRTQRSETDPSKVVPAAIGVEEEAATSLHGRIGNGNLAP